jgi:hypothetical protein
MVCDDCHDKPGPAPWLRATWNPHIDKIDAIPTRAKADVHPGPSRDENPYCRAAAPRLSFRAFPAKHVIHSSQRAPASMPWSQRLLLVVVGGGLLALFAVAYAMSPDPRGYGTHQELGLPACWMVDVFGVRCPSCGMTTAWAHLVRGELIAALHANVGGALLAAASLLAAPWSLISGLRGRWLWQPPSERVVLAAMAVIVSATLLDWCVRTLVVR